MSTIELGRNMRRQAASLESLSRVFRVGCRRKKVSAHGKEGVRASAVHGLDSFNRIKPVFARRLEIKLLRQAIQKSFGRALPDAHRAVALHIRVSAHGT